MNDPKVAQRLQNFTKYQDKEKYKKAFPLPSQ